MDLNDCIKRVFDRPCIMVKANPIIMRAIEDAPEMEEEKPYGYGNGRDWQGNTLVVEETAPGWITELFAGTPSNYGNDEDYEYGMRHLGPYQITANQAVEILDLTETIIFSDPKSMVDAYHFVRELYMQLKEHQRWAIHATVDGEETAQDMAKMENFMRVLKHPVELHRKGVLTDSVIADFFGRARSSMSYKIAAESTDIVITSKSSASDAKSGGNQFVGY
jgi:hypothetical protein